VQALGYGEPLAIGDVSVTFHPAGHVLGSAQILVEAGGRRCRNATGLTLAPIWRSE